MSAELPPLPPGWSYEPREDGAIRARPERGRATFWCGSAQEAASCAELLAQTIADGLISPHAPADERPAQADMFADLAPTQLGEYLHQSCPKHGRFYQPRCWHCKRRRPDRAHRRAEQG